MHPLMLVVVVAKGVKPFFVHSLCNHLKELHRSIRMHATKGKPMPRTTTYDYSQDKDSSNEKLNSAY